MSRRVLCKFFAQGHCLKGEHCGYSHDTGSPSNRVCTFYQKGACTYGSRCRYEHVKASKSPISDASSSLYRPVHVQRHSGTGLNVAANSSSATAENSNGHYRRPIICASEKRSVYPISADPANQSICAAAVLGVCPRGEKCDQLHGNLCPTCEKHCLHPFRPEERRKHIESCQKMKRHLETLRRSEEIECSVCFEVVLSKPVQEERKFGILSECDHTFCISCIRNWRSSSGADANLAHRACPICRKLSHFVIPSIIWYSSKEEKHEIVNSYKEKLRSIDCKHFKFGNGICPFGSSCFYKHTVKPGSHMWNGTLNPDLFRSRFPDLSEFDYEDEDEDEEEYEDDEEDEDEDGSGSLISDIALQELIWEAAAHPDLYGPILADPFNGPDISEVDANANISDINSVGVLYNHLYSPHVRIHDELHEDDENGEEIGDLMRNLMFLSMLQENVDYYSDE